MRPFIIAQLLKSSCIAIFGSCVCTSNALARFQAIGVSEQALKEEVHQRLQALRNYNPHPHYRWLLQFSTGRRHRQPGLLTGRTISRMPHIEITFANGSATVELAGNESKKATGLPTGVGYEVTEAAVAGYEQYEVSGVSGTIATGDSYATFTNKNSRDKDYKITDLK
jgi:hypothetical protein